MGCADYFRLGLHPYHRLPLYPQLCCHPPRRGSVGPPRTSTLLLHPQIRTLRLWLALHYRSRARLRIWLQAPRRTYAVTPTPRSSQTPLANPLLYYYLRELTMAIAPFPSWVSSCFSLDSG
jgi:hypothetical protein